MHDDEEYQYQQPDVLPLKLEVKKIHDYISGRTRYTGDSYIIDRINDDSMPVRITVGDDSELAKYNKWLIDSIENHQTDSKKSAFKTSQRFKRYTFKILSVKRKSSDKPIDVSSDDLLLTPNEMYADRDEIKEYKAKDLTPTVIKKTKVRVSTTKEDRQERIIAILVNLLAKESVKAKSNRYIKGESNINTLRISESIVELAGEYKISKGLSNDTSLAGDINEILNKHSDKYAKLKHI
jgi:hypothetical protein